MSPRVSLTARITLLCVAVALATALLSGLAAARYVAAEARTAQTISKADGNETRRVQRVERAQKRAERRVPRAVALSLLLSLAVGALAGGATARVLTRPLRHTADAAQAMGAGRRDVRVPVEGPPEIAEVATSLNALAEALATSEGRQRRFLLAVSHELRNPLTAVHGFAESVADGVVTGDEARAAGAVILAESGRLEHLVRDLLELARLGADDFRLDVALVDVGTLLDEAARVWSNRAAAISVEPPGVPLPVHTDAARLRQVLDGLADNAVRMTPAGRPVVLAARPAGPDDPPGTRAVLEVRDGGPGLSPDDRRVAFEPGALGARYRDERPVGVGIGLSLVHGLVGRLGGRIDVGEAPEGGARFTVAVPDATR
ncbi:HAMP domain-containing sensor histidine kinase [Cellulomonas sp. URHD0024]|uniref:HAMP domain-containing sensor histidine kinase n=1 Tax=Cellulomonas sp. URHD0024 TaxID=1302620 RepID=UPI00040EF710|nr:HAMP domain-containing sensor histidine kinase [Cellulomonas sp. URHD0024]